MVNIPEHARQLVRGSTRVEVFTGAGMSADSGIATFRDAQTGLWENVDPEAMASLDAWAHDPDPIYAWYLWRRALVARSEPHAGHLALADWAAVDGVDLSVTTQNIDNLHERAGSTEVAHLHGSLFQYRCALCARPWRGQVTELTEPVARLTPPTCPRCGNLVRPSVVWFGESLPHREWELAEQRMREAELVVIIGTSGVVQPAASLPRLAAEAGTPIIEISPQPTELTPLATVFLAATAADALPELVAALK